MATMLAVEVPSPGADLVVVRREVPSPGAGEVLVRIEACGVCHGDAIAKDGTFPGLRYPRVPGHEVVGSVVEIGANVVGWRVGQRVGVGWHGGHCSQCAACRAGDFGACESSLTTALTTDGGYAEYMVARAEAMVAIPDGLASVDAAPLLCAGATSLGALRASVARGGDLVAIHGFGGLGHLAVQFAAKLGFRPVVISRGREKEPLARKLGAREYIDAAAGETAKELQRLGGARVILCTAPSGKAITGLLGGLGRGGQMMIVTFPGDPVIVPAGLLLGMKRSIAGWVGGNMEDTIRFSMLTGVAPMIEEFPLEQAALAYDKMMTAKVHFRSVLKMAK